MLISRQDQVCDQGKVDPFCSPTPNDIWNDGTTHQFLWNPSFPFYSTSETIDLYLYFKENLRFMPIKNWTALPCSSGSLSAQVDNTWFPPSSINNTQKQWTMYGYYLPSNMNPTQELSNPDSQYPRPFNFSVMQLGGESQIGNNYNYTSTNTTSTTDPSPSLSQSNDMVHAFPIWAIIVLAITSSTLFLTLMMALLWFFYRRSSSKDKKQEDIATISISNKEFDKDISPQQPSRPPLNEQTGPDTNVIPPLLSNPCGSDASWQRRSSLLSSSNAAVLEEKVQRMMGSPDWDDQEERRRRLGDELLRKELEADKETTIKDTIASRHTSQIKGSSSTEDTL